MSARLIPAALVAASLSWSALPSWAAVPPSATAPARSPGTVAPVDESALRYYAASRQLARVQAETLRLQRLNPGWQPPRDLWLEELGHDDEEPLWKLYAEDRLSDLEARIAARRRSQPGWAPSRHLVGKIERKRRRAAILTNGRAGRWDAVAAATGRLDDDDSDPELLWTVAEGLVRAKREQDGQAVLGRLLAGTQDPAIRLATVQKALAMLPIERAEELLVLARSEPDGASEFAGIAGDVTRARLAAFLRRQRRDALPAEEVASLGASVTAARDGPGAALLGWYAFARRDHVAALDWFKLAIATGGDAMTAHGLAHTLRRLGHDREAEDVAYAWREPLVQNAILFIDILENALTAENPVRIETSRLERYARVVTETQSGEGAQALAWYATNLCQDEVALAWFERAVAWFPKEATVMGYANVLRRLKRQRDVVAVVNRYDGLFPRVVDLLFRTEEPRAPSRCDAQGRPQQADAAPVAPDAVRREGARSGSDLRIAVPKPFEERSAEAAKMKRTDFPLPVAAENPRREGRSAETPRPEAGAWRREAAERPPLVARRVLGVAAMPYEAFGLSLLPAYDGTLAAPPVAVPERPAAGTLWAEEQADPRLQVPSPTGRSASSADTAEPSKSRFAGRGRLDITSAAGTHAP